MAVLTSARASSDAGRRLRARPCPAGGTVLLALLFVAGFGAVGVPQPVPTGRVHEYRLKAAILYNLARFVEWPAGVFASRTAPLELCVLGVDPFGPVLEETLRGQSVGGRAVQVRRTSEPVESCHVLFVAYSEQKRIAEIVDRIGARSVLTISEVERFTDQGGIIGLATVGERVRFDINVTAAERARLVVSARVMALASAVHRPRGAPQ